MNKTKTAMGSALVGLTAAIAFVAWTPNVTGSVSPGLKAPCPAGEVTVSGDDAVPCDLTAANTLTVLDITEAECDQAGGRWWYEACVDADF